MAVTLGGKSLRHAIVSLAQTNGWLIDHERYAGKNIYGQDEYYEFVLRDIARFREGLAIKPLWQVASGSADHKFPFVVETILACYRYPTVIVVDGGGASAPALGWLRKQSGRPPIIAVYSLSEFISWASTLA